MGGIVEFTSNGGTAQGYLAVPEGGTGLEQKLRDLGKEASLHVVPGVDHAFFNDTRPEVHDAEASRECFGETVEFLRETLG